MNSVTLAEMRELVGQFGDCSAIHGGTDGNAFKAKVSYAKAGDGRFMDQCFACECSAPELFPKCGGAV